MKRLVLILAVLSAGAMFLPVSAPAPAQDTTVNVYHGARPPQATLPPVYGPPAFAGPAYAPSPPLYAGAGCRGYSAGGCHGQQAGGCQGRQGGYMLVPVAAGGCQGRAGGCVGRSGGGCYGSAAFAAGYAQPVAYAPAYGAPAYAAPGTFATPYGPALYGQRLPDGRYATPTGRPEPPRLIPSNDPVTRTARFIFGFDPNY